MRIMYIVLLVACFSYAQPTAMKNSIHTFTVEDINGKPFSLESLKGKKIMIVKQAEAEAESKRLSGEGIAQQRLEIVRGFKESVEDFKKSLDTVTHEEIMQFVLMTQYFDTIKDIGANSKNSSILMPHSPGGMRAFQDQIISGTFVGNKLNENELKAEKNSEKDSDS